MDKYKRQLRKAVEPCDGRAEKAQKTGGYGHFFVSAAAVGDSEIDEAEREEKLKEKKVQYEVG